MKRLLVVALAGLLPVMASAQDTEIVSPVVLPDDAQKCMLPASPDAIPEDATLDQLKAAKADVAAFQEKIGVFRQCLDEANADPDLTDGNKQAIVESYNYSVEMEERVANRFNQAVRDYKARQASAGNN